MKGLIFLCLLVFISCFSCPYYTLQQYEYSVYSQNGEDGILLALLGMIEEYEKKKEKEERKQHEERLKKREIEKEIEREFEIVQEAINGKQEKKKVTKKDILNRYYVEFGVENGKECNTRMLRERYNYTGLMMDGGNEILDISLRKEFITVENILHLFEKYHVPPEFDILSVDLDMFDWWILAKILGSKLYRPKIIVVEVNPTLGVSSSSLRYQFHEVNKYPLIIHHPKATNQTTWDLTRYYGGNPKSFQMLGQEFDYEMVYCESCGVNCFLVDRSYIPQDCYPSGNHFPLPHIPYPCYSTVANDYQRGHPVDLASRIPLRVTPQLILDATNDILSRFDPLIIQNYLATFRFQNRNPSLPLSPKEEISNRFVSLGLFGDEIKFQDGQTEINIRKILRVVESLSGNFQSENQNTVFLVQFCDDLESGQPYGLSLTCDGVASLYFDLILIALYKSQMPVENSRECHCFDSHIFLIQSEVRSLLSRGLSFSPNHVLLLETQKFLSLSSWLTKSISLSQLNQSISCEELYLATVPGFGEFRYAHDLLSVITIEGKENFVSLGITICDSIIDRTHFFSTIFQIDESRIHLLHQMYLDQIKSQIYGITYPERNHPDSPSLDSWLMENSNLPQNQQTSLITLIPPYFRPLFPPLFSSLYPLSPMISGSDKCSSRTSSHLVLIFQPAHRIEERYQQDQSTNPSKAKTIQNIDNNILSLIGCEPQLFTSLHSPQDEFIDLPKNFSECFENLSTLSQNFIPHSLHSVYSTSLNSILQRISHLSFQSFSKSQYEIYQSDFFPFTSPLWSGPLGQSPNRRENTTVIIPLPNPMGTLCQMIQRYERLIPSTLITSFEPLMEYLQVYLRSILNSVKFHDKLAKIYFYLPYNTELNSTLFNEKFTHQVSLLLDYLSANYQPQKAFSINPYRHLTLDENSLECDVSTSLIQQSFIELPRWIMECYTKLIDFMKAIPAGDHQVAEFLYVSSSVRNILDGCDRS